MANNQIVISRIQNRRGRRENLPQPLRPGEIALTGDTEQVWIGGDPELSIAGIKAYSDKNTTTAQYIIDNNLAEIKFDQTFAGIAFGSLLTYLTNSNVLTLVPEDIGWDETFRGTILTITITSPGSGYADGVYPLDVVSPTGSAATVEAIVSGGAVVATSVINGGTNYRYNNTTVTLAFGGGAGATFTITAQDLSGYSVFVALDPSIDTDNSIANLEAELLASPVATQFIEVYSLGASELTDPNHVAPNSGSPRTFDTMGFMPLENHPAAAIIANLVNRVNASTPNEITGLVHTNLNIEIGCCDGNGAGANTSGAMVAYVGSDVPLAPSTWAPISFNTEIADDGNYWDSNNPDIFSVSQTGWYIVTGTIYYTANIGSYAVAISVNGDLTEPFLAVQHQHTSSALIQRTNVAAVVYFEGGDVVRLLSYANTSGRSFSHATFEIVGAASLGGEGGGGPPPTALAPYEVPFHFNRDVIQQEPGQILATFVFSRNIDFYTTSASVAYTSIPPATTQQVFRVNQNGLQVATVTYDIGVNIGTVVWAADTQFVQGDRLDIVGPNSVDPAIDDVSMNLVGAVTLNVNVTSETTVVETSGSVSGTGTTFSPVRLVNDNSAPGNQKYYGTNFAGARGWYDLPPGSTNLGYDAPTRTVTSDTGNDAVLPIVTDVDAGLAPASGGGTINFLRADGTWAEPPGGGVGSLQGAQGIQGIQGYDGLSVQGLQGLQGVSGADGGGQVDIQWQDEGVNLGTAGVVETVNFIGPGVTATLSVNTLTVDITGGGGSGNASVTTADVPPVGPNDGDLWWDSTNGMLMIYYDDGSSSQWVSATVMPVAYISPTEVIGDLIVRGSVEDERLPTGNETEVLTVVGGLPTWALPTLEQRQTLVSDNYELVIADAGNHIYKSSGNAATITIPSNSAVSFNIGTTITIVNDDTEAMTIDITSDTLVWTPSGGTGSRTLAQYGVATLLKVSATRWIISGTGLT